MRKYISQRSFEVIPMSYNTKTIKLLQLCQVFAFANRSRIFYSKRKWLMPGVTCYSIQTLSIYVKKHFLFWDQALSVYSYPKNTEEQTEKGKGQVHSEVCKWVRVHCNKVFSLYIYIYHFALLHNCFYPKINRKWTQHLHISNNHKGLILVSIIVPQNQRVWVGHTSSGE